MAHKVNKVKVGDQEFDTIEVNFEIEDEYWNVYNLVDGGTVRLKTTVQKILRILDADGNPTFTPDGDPNIMIRHRTDVVSSD